MIKSVLEKVYVEMTDLMNKNVEKILEKVNPRSRSSIQEAVSEMVGLNNVSEGDDVTVVDGATYPYEGQTGKVVKLDKDTGLAMVKFPNSEEPVALLTNLLIPLK